MPERQGEPLAERGQTFNRRRFLLGTAAGLGAAAFGLAGGDAGAATKRKLPAQAKRLAKDAAVIQKTLASGVSVPTARWLVDENARPGTIDWVVTGVQTPHAIEGFASQVSAVPGDEIFLFVNTVARSFHVEAYRMGYYQALGGRLIFRSPEVAGFEQRAPTFTPGVNTVECQWEPSLRFTVGGDWPQGAYLLKLVGDGGQQQYVPITIRDDSSTAAFVLQNSVTTWQAYNLWGNYSLYLGPTPGGGRDFANRSRIVSFDRPYIHSWAQGSADFLGNEFPVLYQMESFGLDMTYWTDVDLHVRPKLLLNHRCLLSLGHDEYWSLPMRNGALNALASGTNFGFLGANACYRQIRFQSSFVGDYRQEICYKDATEDPLFGVDNSVVTAPSWDSPPTSWPESELIGDMYQSIGANANMTVTDASAWFWDGCDLNDGQQIPSVVQGEYDRYVPTLPGPTNLDVFAHSPVPGQGNWSDLTYYTKAGGGGVLATGSAAFVNKLSNTTAFPWNVVPKAIPGVTDTLLRALENLYGTFGNKPASQVQPSTGNWTEIYQGAAATQGSATPNATA